MEETKKAIRNNILFSGGYDSTLLLNEVMKNNDSVSIMMIEPTFSGTKVDRERESRRRILNYLKSKYYNCEVTENIVKIDLRYVSFSKDRGLTQPFFWIPIMFTMFNADEDNVVYLSYIRDDDVVLCKSHMSQLIDSCNKLRLNGEKYDIDIRWPLIYFNKTEIIRKLYTEDVFLFENATTCENFKLDHDDCGECVPCYHLKRALIELISDDLIKEEEKDCYRKMLHDKFKMSVTITKYEEEKDLKDTQNQTPNVETEEIL